MNTARSLALRIGLATLATALLAVACTDDPASDPEPVWVDAFDTSGAGSLSGVWGSDPDDVFVVGGSEQGGEVYHYDGNEWAPMEVPPDVPLLVWVYGFGPEDVWSVGVEGGAVRYDGDSWRAVDVGVDEHVDLWGVFGLAPDDLWIVGARDEPLDDGGRLREPVLVHYDGNEFEEHRVDAEQNPRAAEALFKVWGIEDRVFAVGQAGWIIELVDGGWVRRGAGAEANQDFVSLWGTSVDRILVAGGRSNARVAEFDGTDFSTVSPPRLGGLNAAFTDDPDLALVGGVFGFVGRYDFETDEVTGEEAPGGPDAVHAIWGDGEGTYYAVGGSFIEPHRGLAWVRTTE